MVVCPDCGYDNIDGDDICQNCEQSLTGLNRPRPATALEGGILRDRIESLAPRVPVAVSPELPVGEVLDLMVTKHIGCVLIVDDGRLVGIFTERDALTRLNTAAAERAVRPVADFMTHSPVALALKDKIAFAIHKMALGGYRHVPIVQGNRPVGVISIRDILRYAAEKLEAVPS